jgi:murein peptide amidase A
VTFEGKRRAGSKGRKVAGLLAVATFAGGAIALADDDDGAAHVRAAGRSTVAPAHATAHVVMLGRSVKGRAIRAVALGDPNAPATALVVGCIHGDEPAGITVVDRVGRWTPPAGISLWLVPDLNPDGRAANTRQNADGVDLNRNFPFRWRPLGPRGTLHYAGTGPLSEPESRIAHSLILRLKPRLTIWLHQPFGITDRSGGDVRLERRFARLSRLPLRQLPRYHGSATSWQDFRVRVGTAFVVELPPGPPAPSALRRYARAVERLVTEVAGTR